MKRNNNIRILNLCEKIINQKLSLETVFTTPLMIEFIAKSVLDDSQIKEYNKIYRMNLYSENLGQNNNNSLSFEKSILLKYEKEEGLKMRYQE